MKKLTKLFIINLAILLTATPLLAENTGISNESPGIMRGIRPIGMGNAFLAMPGTDYNAQFYNPAAINDYESKLHYLFPSPSADFTIQTYKTLKDVADLNGDLDNAADNSARLSVFRTFINDHIGEFHHAAVAMPLFHIRHKYFAIGLIADSRATVSFRDQSIENFEFKSDNVAGISAGSAYSFFDDTLQIGGNVKFLYKVGIEERITTNDIINQDLSAILGFNSWQKGFGVGVDIGGKYKLPFWQEYLQPTLALTVQDIANTRFTGGASSIPMSVSAGMGIFPKYKGIDFAVLADFREIQRRQNILKKFHAGLEAKFPQVAKMRFALRAGSNQGYLAVGASAEFPVVTLDIAYYGEELGEVNYEKPSYRLASQLSFGF